MDSTIPQQVMAWAREGARMRLDAIEAERAAILRQFPELEARAALATAYKRAVGRGRGNHNGNTSARTPEWRAKQSEAMRRAWGRRREAEAANGVPAPEAASEAVQ